MTEKLETIQEEIKNTGPTRVVLLSGGLDSVYLLDTLLKESKDNIFILRIKSNYLDESQREKETEAINKSYEYLEDKYSLGYKLQSISHEVDIQIGRAEVEEDGSYHDINVSRQQLLFHSGLFSILSFTNSTEVDFYNGALESDTMGNLYNTESITKYISTISRDSLKVNIKYPLITKSKYELLYDIMVEDPKLLSLVSWCEVAMCNDICICNSCMTMYLSIIKMLNTNRWYFARASNFMILEESLAHSGFKIDIIPGQSIEIKYKNYSTIIRDFFK